jgi:hypothetical protein
MAALVLATAGFGLSSFRECNKQFDAFAALPAGALIDEAALDSTFGDNSLKLRQMLATASGDYTALVLKCQLYHRMDILILHTHHFPLHWNGTGCFDDLYLGKMSQSQYSDLFERVDLADCNDLCRDQSKCVFVRYNSSSRTCYLRDRPNITGGYITSSGSLTTCFPKSNLMNLSFYCVDYSDLRGVEILKTPNITKEDCAG